MSLFTAVDDEEAENVPLSVSYIGNMKISLLKYVAANAPLLWIILHRSAAGIFACWLFCFPLKDGNQESWRHRLTSLVEQNEIYGDKKKKKRSFLLFISSYISP